MANYNQVNVGQHGRKKDNKSPILSDSLDDDVLAKLKAAKIELTKVAKENEVKHQKQIRQEREDLENNKSFEELLNEQDELNFK